MSEPITEVSFVIVTVVPVIFALSIGLVTMEISHQSLPIFESIGALTFLIKVLKLTLISLPFLVC